MMFWHVFRKFVSILLAEPESICQREGAEGKKLPSAPSRFGGAEMRKKEPFVMVESRVLVSEELSIYEKMVYCVLCSFADNKTGICYPSYETIAARAGCSRRKAIACIETLAEKGLLRKEERATRNGGNRTNIYYLHEEVADKSANSDKTSDEFDALVLPDESASVTPCGESGTQSDAPDSQGDESDTPELDSQNYISSYTPSNYPCDMGRIDEIKERIDYDYFEEFFPEKLPFLDILCVCILELYDETFACDRKLLNRINGSTVLGFFDHIKGKDYSNVRNMRGYFKKMLLEYLRAEVLLVATANV